MVMCGTRSYAGLLFSTVYSHTSNRRFHHIFDEGVLFFDSSATSTASNVVGYGVQPHDSEAEANAVNEAHTLTRGKMLFLATLFITRHEKQCIFLRLLPPC